jgi:hypothetical protein
MILGRIRYTFRVYAEFMGTLTSALAQAGITRRRDEKMNGFPKKMAASVIGLALVLIVTQLASAQRGRGFGGRFLGGTSQLRLASLDQIQTELNLSEDQKKTVTELNAKLREQRTELFQAGGDRAAAREKLAKLTSEATAKCAETLDEKQRTRLQEIYIQVNGAAALSDEKVAEMLAITDEQKAKLADVREPGLQSMRDAFQDFQNLSNEERRERVAEWRSEFNAKLLAALSEEQRGKFEQMKGEKIEIDLTQLRGRRRNN